ncbi:MAG TPA: hypothetical protein DGL25_03830 [Dehalococcoidia bacterium]|nr:hypothetical protein [Dehalococcoidia bacterium]
MGHKKGALWPGSVTRQYNHVRPHSALGYRPPAPVVINPSIAAAS